MRGLTINKYYLEKFEEGNTLSQEGDSVKISYRESDIKISGFVNEVCDTSLFEKILHTIIDTLCVPTFAEKKEIMVKNYLHELVSKKDYLPLVLYEFLDIVEDED